MFGQRQILQISKKTCLENQFSSIINKNLFYKILKPKEPTTKVPINNHTFETNVPMESVGWAGQPIVKRVHPILPEVPGDIADTLKTVSESSRAQQEIHPVSIQGSIEASIKRDYLPNETVEQSVEAAMKMTEETKPNQTRVEVDIVPERVKNRVRSHDTISFLNEDAKKLNDGDAENLIVKAAAKTENTNVITKSSKPTKIDKPIRNYVQSGLPKALTKPKYSVKKSKKIRRKTKILSLKGDSDKKTNGSKGINKSANGSKSMKLNKNKPNFNPQFLLNQRGYTLNAIPKGFYLMENRQYGTSCQSFPCARVGKEDCAFPPCGKPGKRGKISKKVAQDDEGKYPEDCKCPTLAENKFRADTKICGEAKAMGTKKDIKTRKMKMCLVEKKIKQRIRTFVCKSAAFAKERKQKSLPKCPPPEKKVAPRALICPPILEDEIAKAEVKCVKQVDEVKVRSRTKVCKPVIIHAKEEVSLKIEKTVCVEKKTKNVVSRHTSICLPPKPKHSNASSIN